MDALLYEIELQKDYLQGESIQSVYFGGGTPSLLSVQELDQFFDKLHQHHTIDPKAEITLETNPDDLTFVKLKDLAQTPINRLSIGIQSFHNEDLTFMNRAHNADEAEQCIDWAQEVGFSDLTVDLIYGTPTMSDEQWKYNVSKAIEKKITHLSCYCLTVEPNTALDHFVKKGKAKAVDEDKASQQFEYLMDTLQAEGFLHYEISNFALPNHEAVHNSNYWKGAQYLGLGPSAHSFNGTTRQWNVANNSQYIKAIQSNSVPSEEEHLTKVDQYNEYVMTSLRTMWGCKKKRLEQMGEAFYSHFRANAVSPIEKGWIIEQADHYLLTQAGKLLADRIAMELFLENEV